MSRKADTSTIFERSKAGFEGGLAAWVDGQTFLEVWRAYFSSLDEWKGDYDLTEGSETFGFLMRLPHKMSQAQLEGKIGKECPEGGIFGVRFMRATGEKLKQIGNTYLIEIKSAPPSDEDLDDMSRKELEALKAQNEQFKEAIEKLKDDLASAKRAGDTSSAAHYTAQLDTMMNYQRELQKELNEMRDKQARSWEAQESARRQEYKETNDTAKELLNTAKEAITESVAEMSATTRFLAEKLERQSAQPQQGGSGLSDLMQFFMSQQADNMKMFREMFEKMDERSDRRMKEMQDMVKDVLRAPSYRAENPASPPALGAALPVPSVVPSALPSAPVDPMDVTLATLRKNKELAELMGYAKPESSAIVEDKKSGLGEITELLQSLGVKDLLHAKMLEKPEAAGSRARPPKMAGVSASPPASASPPPPPRYEIPSFSPQAIPQQPAQPQLQPPQSPYAVPMQPQQANYAPISPAAFVNGQSPQQQPAQPQAQPQAIPQQPAQPQQQPPQSPYAVPPPPQQPQAIPQQPAQPQFVQPPPQQGQQNGPQVPLVQLPDGSYAPAEMQNAPKKEIVDSGDPDEASGATDAIKILPELEAYAGHLKPLLTQIFYAAPNAPPPKKLIAAINPDPSFRSLLSAFKQDEITDQIAEMINDPIVRDPSRRAWLSSVVKEYMTP